MRSHNLNIYPVTRTLMFSRSQILHDITKRQTENQTDPPPHYPHLTPIVAKAFPLDVIKPFLFAQPQ